MKKIFLISLVMVLSSFALNAQCPKPVTTTGQYFSVSFNNYTNSVIDFTYSGGGFGFGISETFKIPAYGRLNLSLPQLSEGGIYDFNLLAEGGSRYDVLFEFYKQTEFIYSWEWGYGNHTLYEQDAYESYRFEAHDM